MRLVSYSKCLLLLLTLGAYPVASVNAHVIAVTIKTPCEDGTGPACYVAEAIDAAVKEEADERADYYIRENTERAGAKVIGIESCESGFFVRSEFVGESGAKVAFAQCGASSAEKLSQRVEARCKQLAKGTDIPCTFSGLAMQFDPGGGQPIKSGVYRPETGFNSSF